MSWSTPDRPRVSGADSSCVAEMKTPSRCTPARCAALPDPVLVDVEQALLVDDLDRDGVRPVGDDHRARADRVGDTGVEARRVAAAAEQVALPTAVAVAVEERIAGVEVAGALEVLVGLLERERPRAVVLRALRHRGGAVRGIVGHEPGARWGEVPDRRPDAEVRVMPAAGGSGSGSGRSKREHRGQHQHGDLCGSGPHYPDADPYSQNGSLLFVKCWCAFRPYLPGGSHPKWCREPG